jgi:small subunit ribosomal protein S9
LSDQPTPESTRPQTPQVQPTPAPAAAAPTQTTVPGPATPATATAVEPARPPGSQYFWGTGRRKTSVARVRVRLGEGKFLVNGRDIDKYFSEERDRKDVIAPLRAAGVQTRLDVLVNVRGGGPSGQAGAVVLGIARALRAYDPHLEGQLRDGGYLTRDSRMVERKKYGQSGARRRFQFSKR